MRVDQPELVTARNDLHAAVGDRRRIERGPQRDLRIAIQLAPAVLMPRQKRSLARRLVHEHGAEAGDGHVVAEDAPADLAEDRTPQVLHEQRIVL